MRRQARVNRYWETPDSFQWEHVRVELLMDIRDELQKLNAVLNCRNFLAIPSKLDKIERNTCKPKRKRA